MTLITKITDASFTDTTIPKLFRDQVANDGTLDIFDALDSYSWEGQDDPVEGSEVWKSLIGDTPNNASFEGSVGFSAGFTTDTTDADQIVLPDSFRFSGTDERCVIFWLKPETQTQANAKLFGWKVAGTGDSPYFAYMSGDNITFTQGNGGTQVLHSDTKPSGPTQYAYSFEYVSGEYVVKLFKNGALITTVATGLASRTLTGSAASLAGVGLNGQAICKYYRAVADDLSGTSPEELVALDYATYSTRFT